MWLQAGRIRRDVYKLEDQLQGAASSAQQSLSQKVKI